MTLGRFLTAAAVTVAFQAASGSASAQSLDFQFYRTKVEPIFNKKRPTHARCVVCHSGGARLFRLEPLAQGAANWTEEQSRANFERVSRLVKPGDIKGSLLLMQPLAHDGGGNEMHSGGRQFATQNDPDWKIIADWVRGAK
jgi:hypothetical protein